MYVEAKTQLEKIYSSIAYDIDEKLAKFETTVFINIGQPAGKGIMDYLLSLEINLPITEEGEFEIFNASLATDNEKLTALVS